jgi:hypothetical protein
VGAAFAFFEDFRAEAGRGFVGVGWGGFHIGWSFNHGVVGVGGECDGECGRAAAGGGPKIWYETHVADDKPSGVDCQSRGADREKTRRRAGGTWSTWLNTKSDD